MSSIEALYRRMNKKALKQKQAQSADAALVSGFIEKFAPDIKERTRAHAGTPKERRKHSVGLMKRRYGG